MSIQFGRWNFDGQLPAAGYIERVSRSLAPYGPDSNEAYEKEGLKILYRAFHTTKESHREAQPHVAISGAVITWDGRLDNRAELVGELSKKSMIKCGTPSSLAAAFESTSSEHDVTDVQIVAGAYEQWGVQCLEKLIGDWALSIWNPREPSLLLAKDPMGVKHLYYLFDNNEVTWCTILDPLVLLSGKTLAICEEYVAGWFAARFPASNLTPYVGIHAVPPSSSVLLCRSKYGVKHIVRKYWDFDPDKRIRYRTDGEYEEHFRTVFRQAVRRRLRSDRPILAELSGGIDSSSIVCMADIIIGCGQADCPRLDTITWYDQSKPNWGEFPYFTKVEEKRGRTGLHIDAGSLKDADSHESFGADFAGDCLAPTPIPNGGYSEFFKQREACISSGGYRVILSGIGGEQPTGGCTPRPTPELQNLLVRARFLTLARQLNAWAVKMRKRRFPLLWDAIRGFFPLMFQELPEYVGPVCPWFYPSFVRRNGVALRGYPSRTKLFGPLPSFQEHIAALECERRVMAHFALQPTLLLEQRYPYHDRDLREFAYAIPREQTVGVGKRRFLMRRALVGIVPEDLLNRKQKSFSPQEDKERTMEWPSLAELGERMVSSFLGIVDGDRFWESLEKARRNEQSLTEVLKRTLFFESWLRHLAVHGLTGLMKPQETPLVFREQRVQMPVGRKGSAS